MTAVDYGRVRCSRCYEWYGLDETHVCASAAPLALGPVLDGAAAVPDPDRPHPAGLTWVSPLTPRPIPLGPSEDHPDLRPALALDAGRFWSGARHGLAVGRARIDLEEGAAWFAFAPNMRTAHERAAFLADAAAAWTARINDYAKELAS